MLRLQPHGKRPPTCLACKEPIAIGDLKICRRSDISSGGRWLHFPCVPGGLRSDDTLTTDEAETPPQVAAALAGRAATRDSSQQMDCDSIANSTLAAAVPPEGSSPQAIAGDEEELQVLESTLQVLDEDVWRRALLAKVPVLSAVPLHLRSTHGNAKSDTSSNNSLELNGTCFRVCDDS